MMTQGGSGSRSKRHRYESGAETEGEIGSRNSFPFFSFFFFFLLFFFSFFLFILAGGMGVTSQDGNKVHAGDGGGGSTSASAKRTRAKPSSR